MQWRENGCAVTSLIERFSAKVGKIPLPLWLSKMHPTDLKDMFTIQDVAARAGVSVSTMPKLLNGREAGMRPETLARDRPLPSSDWIASRDLLSVLSTGPHATINSKNSQLQPVGVVARGFKLQTGAVTRVILQAHKSPAKSTSESRKN